MAFKGERLKELRKAHGYTLEQLCEKLDIGGKSTIAGYERNFREPNTRTIAKMAEVFNTSTDYLLGKTDNKNTITDNKNLAEILREPDFHFNGSSISDRDLEFLLSYLKRISDEPNNKDENSNKQINQEQ